MRMLRGYALAALSVTIALFLTLAIRPISQQFKFLLFFLAVFISATGGVGPGVFATLLSVAMADYFLMQPLHSFAISNPQDIIPLLIFCGVGFAITWTTHRLQRSEEANRAAAAVVESSADSIMQQSLDNTILNWNKGAEEIYGYTAKEAIGRPVSLIVPPDRLEEMQHLLEQVHLGRSFQSYETMRIRKDGKRVDVALTLSPVLDQEKRIVGVSSIAREITRQKHTEQAIRDSNERLERQTQQLKRQTHELKLLAEMADLLQASSSPKDVYAIAAHFAQTLIPATSGALYVYSPTAKDLEVVSQWGELQTVEQEILAPDDCWGLRRGRVHFVADAHTNLLCRHLPDPPPACYLCAPMIAQGETVGLLHLRMCPPLQALSGEASTDAVEFPWPATPIAEQLALAVANMNLREALRAQSIRDPLTSWFNRRFMEETLEHEIRRAARKNGPLAIITLDVDNLKEFNDLYGHEAGDLALQNLCETLKSHIRSEDVACRFGGDEFVLILPDTSAEVALQRAEEMRAVVGSAVIRYHSDSLKPVTLSMGIATFPTDGKTSKELLRASDAALYRAKTEGRDRTRQ